ncbi:hypothetical protein [Thalassospira indica]|uniref:Uncharacterized protein n=1 Tax=Thalassospira indica TaxID=1891279 RepID=A0ABN5NIJ7_9PROT|nr:hypothetical protein [Thalassospira indica]AXO14197.1 hypothetical protein DY252_08120 [Thalassospira indica]OAZ12327.1 hypothetical protein TH15_17220 [Thalassospira profundimaris]
MHQIVHKARRLLFGVSVILLFASVFYLTYEEGLVRNWIALLILDGGKVGDLSELPDQGGAYYLILAWEFVAALILFGLCVSLLNLLLPSRSGAAGSDDQQASRVRYSEPIALVTAAALGAWATFIIAKDDRALVGQIEAQRLELETERVRLERQKVQLEQDRLQLEEERIITLGEVEKERSQASVKVAEIENIRLEKQLKFDAEHNKHLIEQGTFNRVVSLWSSCVHATALQTQPVGTGGSGQYTGSMKQGEDTIECLADLDEVMRSTMYAGVLTDKNLQTMLELREKLIEINKKAISGEEYDVESALDFNKFFLGRQQD